MSPSAPPNPLHRPLTPTPRPAVEPLEDRRLLSSTGSISGQMYVDLSGDGKKNHGEKAVPNVTVYLDTNDNQTPDAGEPTMLTTSKGKFGFKKLPRVAQHLRAVLPDQYTTVSPPGGAWFVDLRSKKSFSKRDFGLWPKSLGEPPVLGKHPTTPEKPLSVAFYNTGATQANNPDGTNTKPLLGGAAGEGGDPYWVVEPLNPGGGPLAFQPTYYSYNPSPFRVNADLNVGSPQPDSTYIAPARDGTPIAPGQYLYATAFDLTGIEPSTAFMNAFVVPDGRLADVRLNGQSIGSAGQGQRGTPLPLPIRSGFVAGVNTLEFLVDSTAGGTGALRVDGLNGSGQKLQPGPITLFNTGVAGPNKGDGTNAARLPAGALDGHWLVSTPDNGFPFYADDTSHHYIYNNALTTGKFGNPFVASGSRVLDDEDLAPSSAGVDSSFVNPVGDGTADLATGTYIYRTYFDLTGLDASSASVTGTVMAADSLVDIYINGNKATGTAAGASYLPTTQQTFTVTGTQGMVSGINVLDFIVTRGADSKGTALRIDGLRGIATGSAARSTVPYPLRLPLPPLPPIQPPAGNG